MPRSKPPEGLPWATRSRSRDLSSTNVKAANITVRIIDHAGRSSEYHCCAAFSFVARPSWNVRPVSGAGFCKRNPRTRHLIGQLLWFRAVAEQYACELDVVKDERNFERMRRFEEPVRDRRFPIETVHIHRRGLRCFAFGELNRITPHEAARV